MALKITNHSEITLRHEEEVDMDDLRRFLHSFPGNAKVKAHIEVIRADRPYEPNQKLVTLKASWEPGPTDPTIKRGYIRD